MKAIVSTADYSVVLKDVPIPTISPNEILIKVHAVASNPTDWKKLSRAVEGIVMGCDFAGEVVEIGSAIPEATWKKGDRIASYLHGGVSPELGGSFAEFTVCFPEMLVRLPDNLSYEKAAGLGISGFTACQVLFERHKWTPLKPNTNSEPILVWSAATALGMWVVQLAKLSGYTVIATASPANHDLIKSLGASAVFDYRDDNVSKKINEYTRNELGFAVDCISEGDTPQAVARSLSTKGGKIATILAVDSQKFGIPNHVEIEGYLVYKLIGKPWRKPYDFDPAKEPHLFVNGAEYAKLLSHLLADAKLTIPPIQIMPKGLASIDEGLKITKEGRVRGTKLVYRISDTPSM